jgi:hypothetical protein
MFLPPTFWTKRETEEHEECPNPFNTREVSEAAEEEEKSRSCGLYILPPGDG